MEADPVFIQSELICCSFSEWLKAKSSNRKIDDFLVSLASKVAKDADWPSSSPQRVSNSSESDQTDYLLFRAHIRMCSSFDIKSIDEFELAWDVYVHEVLASLIAARRPEAPVPAICTSA